MEICRKVRHDLKTFFEGELNIESGFIVGRGSIWIFAVWSGVGKRVSFFDAVSD